MLPRPGFTDQAKASRSKATGPVGAGAVVVEAQAEAIRPATSAPRAGLNIRVMGKLYATDARKDKEKAAGLHAYAKCIGCAPTIVTLAEPVGEGETAATVG